jgi:hypothetical protein
MKVARGRDLSRLRRDRPRRRRAAEQRYELADSTPKNGRRLLRCGISTLAMTAWGQILPFRDFCGAATLPLIVLQNSASDVLADTTDTAAGAVIADGHGHTVTLCLHEAAATA